MTLFTFAKEKKDGADVAQAIRVLNWVLREKYAGCSAEIVRCSDDGNRVTVSLNIAPEVESAECMDWFADQLARESILLVNDDHLRRTLKKLST